MSRQSDKERYTVTRSIGQNRTNISPVPLAGIAAADKNAKISPGKLLSSGHLIVTEHRTIQCHGLIYKRRLDQKSTR